MHYCGMVSSRGFIPILVAVLVSALVFGGGGYYIAQKISRSSELKTAVAVTATSSSATNIDTLISTPATETQKSEAKTSVVVQNNSTLPKSNIAVPIVSQSESAKSAVSSSIAFRISDTHVAKTKYQATITWHTSLPARSRLIFKALDNKETVYESLSDISTEHKVQILNLHSSANYSYHITAKTLDTNALEDDLYGSFQTDREFVISLGTQEGDCRDIVVEDTIGTPLVGASVTVRGIMKAEGYTSYKHQTSMKTNSSGIVQYCELANIFEVSTQGLSVTLP